jgi:glucokinase
MGTRQRPLVVGVDLGGTEIKGILADEGGGTLAHEDRLIAPDAGTEAAVAALQLTVAELVAACPEDATVAGVGVAVPGLVDEERGVAVRSARFGWRELPIARLVAEQVDAPVTLGHDVRLGAFAEQCAGAAVGCRDWLYVAVGTGVGAALVIGGHARGGAAGEIGHVVIDPVGEPCRCGGSGCLETVASGPAVAARYARRGGEPAVAASEIARRAGDGEPLAAAVWGSAVEALGAALAAATALVDLERIVVGGGVASAGELLLNPLHAAMAARLPLRVPPPLSTGALGSRAGCAGAAMLARLRMS